MNRPLPTFTPPAPRLPSSGRLSSVASELLVLRCQAGQEQALRVLYEYWQPRFARTVARLTGRPEAVADVCQDAWLAIARGLGRLDDPARFPAWAHRIVARRCTDWIRQRMQRARVEPLVDDPVAPGAAGGDGNDIDGLRSALRQLPAEQQVVIALHYGENLGVRAIGLALDIPIGTVKSRLHSGRRALSDMLERSES